MRPYVSIQQAELLAANTLLDVNPRYDADWVRTYASVEITTIQDGQVLTKVGKDDTLTAEQKAQLAAADLGTTISILVRYMPENNLSHNDLQEMDFSFAVEADRDARFPGGAEKLNAYLSKQAIVDENGVVHQVEAVEPLQDSTVAALLVETVCNMPAWEPARFSTGIAVDQKFALTVGNQANCKIPLLNIR